LGFSQAEGKPTIDVNPLVVREEGTGAAALGVLSTYAESHTHPGKSHAV
jgi:hypothetical protein